MYAELKCSSNFSFLRGASDSREYILRASEIGIPALAITDLNGVYSLPRAWEACLKLENSAGARPVKLIAGTTLTIENKGITLLAQNREAYGLMCRLITKAHADKPKGQACLTWEEFATHLGRSPASTASGMSSGLTAIANMSGVDADIFYEKIPLLHDLFEKRLYLGLCFYDDGFDEKRIEITRKLSSHLGIRIVAHNDVHYHSPERRRIQDCLSCIREGTTIEKAGTLLHANAERYLKSPLQMRAQFRDFPDAIRATLDIAESCTFRLSELRYLYPKELTPHGHTPQSYLEELVFQGAQDIYRGTVSKAVSDQIEHELKLIRKLEYASYFLTLHDIVRFARDRGILCQGRGSAANSICCYLLGITSIDPVRMGLLFERFISEERKEPPDIDVDFEHERREEVIQYVYSRYGRDHAGMVSAIRTYQSRSAFQEMAKAVGVPVGTISARKLERDFDTIAGPEHREKLPLIKELAEEIIDFPRHLSIHSGGFTLSALPIIETVPIEPARMKDRSIIQWDKHDLDTVGLLKVDLLSLGFLTALHKICDLLGISTHDIPPEDPATYAMIQAGQTEGTFQIESRAQKSMLPLTKPACFYDLVVQVAIVRPGPNVGQMIHPYIKRRGLARRGIPYRFDDPIMESILGRTHGVPIFQEQIMKLAIAKAGFSAGEADQLRRAIAAWRSAESVGEMSTKLYEGLLKNGVKPEYARELLEYTKGYAHYGFPESHAASFALISYQSAYLKQHHPAQFLCGLLNSQPMGFYPIDTLIQDARRRGVRILPIDPNRSSWDCVMEGEAVRMGFRNVRKIREEDVRHMSAQNERELTERDIKSTITREELEVASLSLERERKENGPFTSFEDFVSRTNFSREVIGAMAMADVFLCFGMDARHTYWKSLAPLSTWAELGHADHIEHRGHRENSVRAPLFAQMTPFETIHAQYRGLGYSLEGHWMSALRSMHADLPDMSSSRARLLRHGASVSIAGILMVMQRPPTTKGVCFITIEDEDGTMDTILKKEVYESHKTLLHESRFLVLSGRIQRREGSVCVLVDHVRAVAFAEATPIATGMHPREIARGLGV